MNDWTGSSKQRKEYDGGGIAVSNQPVVLKPNVEDLPDSPRTPLKTYKLEAGTKVLIRRVKSAIRAWENHTTIDDMLLTNLIQENEIKGYKVFRRGKFDIMAFNNDLKVELS